LLKDLFERLDRDFIMKTAANCFLNTKEKE